MAAPLKVAILVAVALAAAGAAIGLAILAEPAEPAQPAASAPAPDDHVMTDEERCQHMPEHCQGGPAAG